MDTTQAPGAATVRGVRVRHQVLDALAVAVFTAVASGAVSVVLLVLDSRGR